jgi:hypothetical protein
MKAEDPLRRSPGQPHVEPAVSVRSIAHYRWLGPGSDSHRPGASVVLSLLRDQLRGSQHPG